MSIQKTSKIALLTAQLALAGAQCWGAASNPLGEKQNLSRAVKQAAINGNAVEIQKVVTVVIATNAITEECAFAQMPNEIFEQIAEFLDQASFLELALVSKKTRRVVQAMPLYTSAQLLRQYNDNAQEALFDSSKNNKAWAIDYLVRAGGANVNAKDMYGNTALMWATRMGHGAVVAQLIAARADVNVKDDYSDETVLTLAALLGRKAIVAQLLTAKAIDVNAKNDNGKTALYLAALHGHEAIVAQLLATKAIDVNTKDNYGITALYWAAAKNYEPITAQLIAAGADYSDLPDNLKKRIEKQICKFN